MRHWVLKLLKKTARAVYLSGNRGVGAADLLNQALHRITRLRTAFDPVLHAIKVDLGIQARFSRIVVANYLDELPITGAPLICDYNFVVRCVFSAFAAKSDDDHNYLCFG